MDSITTPPLVADDARRLALLGIPGDVAGRLTEYVHALNAKQTEQAQQFPYLASSGVLYEFFDVDPGAKGGGRWVRVVQMRPSRSTDTAVYVAASVHSFVEKSTGDVYKSAGWDRPAKGARYRLLDDDSRTAMFSRLDTYTSYLYR